MISPDGAWLSFGGKATSWRTLPSMTLLLSCYVLFVYSIFQENYIDIFVELPLFVSDEKPYLLGKSQRCSPRRCRCSISSTSCDVLANILRSTSWLVRSSSVLSPRKADFSVSNATF